MKTELKMITKPKSTIGEDIRTIRTNIEFSLLDDDKKIIMITSSKSSEGKSFTASNLAISFAQSKKKVLLIDCDLRLGRTHKIFGLTNKYGLTNLILNYKNKNFIKKATQETKQENLYVITRGTTASNPSELLASKRFSDILNILKEDYDYIVIDSAPLIGLSDSVILSTLVDKIAIVCKYGETNINELEESKKLLSNVSEKIAGVILNKVPKQKSRYGSYYYYGYYK